MALKVYHWPCPSIIEKLPILDGADIEAVIEASSSSSPD